MTNMSQFSDGMDEISFLKSSSTFDETDISLNVSICENEGGPGGTLFNQTLSLRGRRGLHSSQNTVSKQMETSGSLQQPKPRRSSKHCPYSTISFFCKVSIRATPV